MKHIIDQKGITPLLQTAPVISRLLLYYQLVGKARQLLPYGT